MADYSKYLIIEEPLVVLPTIARTLDINKAIILQQVQYWLLKSNHERDGHTWIWNSYSQWADQFPWLTPRAVRHHISGLEKLGLLVSGDYNRDRRDNTKWYRIDYDAVDRLVELTTKAAGGLSSSVMPCSQECPSQVASNDRPLPETTAETTPKESLKNSYGEFQNVHLKDEELEKLRDRFAAAVDSMIENLSGYKKSKGKSYRDDYATILNWARRDNGQSSDSMTDTSMATGKHAQGLYAHTLNRSLDRCIEKGIDGPALRSAINRGDVPGDILDWGDDERQAYVDAKVPAGEESGETR